MNLKKFFKKFLFVFFVFFLFCFWFFFLGKAPSKEKIDWGVVFSQKHAQNLGLDWKEAFSQILEDLQVKRVKILVHWDLIEKEPSKFDFQDLDWMVNFAKEKGAKIILVVGIKPGRWPECHIPQWLDCSRLKESCQKAFFEYLREIVLRYEKEPSIFAWQLENEPFFPFGDCPKITESFYKKELSFLKSLDPKRPIIFSDSGEFSFWTKAAKLGDIVSITLHRRVYFKEIKKYIAYPFSPAFYWRKAKIVEKIFKKNVMIGELQAEPWCKNLIYNCDLAEQKITMDDEKFKENVEFAKNTGIKTIYFWGAEWWYWMKKIQKDEKIWQEAKKIFLTN